MIIRNRMKKNDAKENQSTFNWCQPSFVVEENRQDGTTKLINSSSEQSKNSWQNVIKKDL